MGFEGCYWYTYISDIFYFVSEDFLVMGLGLCSSNPCDMSQDLRYFLGEGCSCHPIVLYFRGILDVN